MRESRFTIPVFDETLEVSRFIGDLGNSEGNTVIFLGGVHGNETAGVGALHTVFRSLELTGENFKGRAVALIGNLEATRLNQRYIYKDMNRIWNRDTLDDLHYGRLDTRHTEYAELQAVYTEVKSIIENATGKVYVIDLHTTSSPTIPFIVTNKSDPCLSFTNEFPMPVISGLTGFLDGTLLSYINDLGHIGLAYEAGQHKSTQSLMKHESFIWLCLHQTGICPDLNPEFIQKHHQVLEEELVTRTNHFRIISRYKIKPEEQFKMNAGYANFQKIHAGEELAVNQDGPIRSPYDGYVFMPLYQPQGEDGFFIIKPELD
jgi:predicted deacylase